MHLLAQHNTNFRATKEGFTVLFTFSVLINQIAMHGAGKSYLWRQIADVSNHEGSLNVKPCENSMAVASNTHGDLKIA